MLSDQTSLPMFNLFGFVLTALAAGWTDLRSWRIPNRLLAPAAAGALMLAAFLPAGIGLTDGLLGALLGLGLLLPLYLARGMAAGDVKLMAVLGLFIGPEKTVELVLLSCLVGGAWAGFVLMSNSPWMQLLRASVGQMSERLHLPALNGSGSNDGLRGKRGRFPFGAAVAIASVVLATGLCLRSA